MSQNHLSLSCEVPSLLQLCQYSVLNAVEESGYNARFINDIAKRLTLLDHLLEPLLAALVKRNTVTDVAFLTFLNPRRYALEISGLRGVRSSTLKLIGYNCSRLVVFNASHCSQMSNSIVRSVLQGCEVLEQIRLDGCPRISDAAFDPLHCPFDRLKAADSLKFIGLKGCQQITGSFSAVLTKVFRSLETVDLSQCKHIVSSAVSDLLTHGTLQNIDLSFVGSVGDEAFSEQSSKYLALRSLNLSQNRITDVSLLSLANSVCNLSCLRLQWCGGISDSGVMALAEGCRFITVLDLQSCNITDASLVAISSSCNSLVELDVSWCVRITDTGIRALSDGKNNMPLFMVLKATWCAGISDDSIVELCHLDAFKCFESFGYSMSAECRQKLEQGGVTVITEMNP